MLNFERLLKLKIIGLTVAVALFAESTVYGIDLPPKHLRVPMLGAVERIAEYIEQFKKDLDTRISAIDSLVKDNPPYAWGLISEARLRELSRKGQIAINNALIELMHRNFMGLKTWNEEKLAAIKRDFFIGPDGGYHAKKIPGTYSVVPEEYPEAAQMVLHAELEKLLTRLPEGIDIYRVGPGVYHISIAVFQDSARELSEEQQLTFDERMALIELMKDIATKHGPITLTLKGIRFGDDGGIIACWEDNGTIELIRKEYFEKPSEISPGIAEKIKMARPKPFVYTTLARIINLTPEVLKALQENAKEFYDLSSLDLSVTINELRVMYETQWFFEEYEVIETIPLNRDLERRRVLARDKKIDKDKVILLEPRRPTQEEEEIGDAALRWGAEDWVTKQWRLEVFGNPQPEAGIIAGSTDHTQLRQDIQNALTIIDSLWQALLMNKDERTIATSVQILQGQGYQVHRIKKPDGHRYYPNDQKLRELWIEIRDKVHLITEEMDAPVYEAVCNAWKYADDAILILKEENGRFEAQVIDRGKGITLDDLKVTDEVLDNRWDSISGRGLVGEKRLYGTRTMIEHVDEFKLVTAQNGNKIILKRGSVAPYHIEKETSQYARDAEEVVKQLIPDRVLPEREVIIESVLPLCFSVIRKVIDIGDRGEILNPLSKASDTISLPEDCEDIEPLRELIWKYWDEELKDIYDEAHKVCKIPIENGINAGGASDISTFLLVTNALEGDFFDLNFYGPNINKNFLFNAENIRTYVGLKEDRGPQWSDDHDTEKGIGWIRVETYERKFNRDYLPAVIWELWALGVYEIEIEKINDGVRLTFDWKHPKDDIAKTRTIFLHGGIDIIDGLTKYYVEKGRKTNCYMQKALCYNNENRGGLSVLLVNIIEIGGLALCSSTDMWGNPYKLITDEYREYFRSIWKPHGKFGYGDVAIYERIKAVQRFKEAEACL